MFGLISKKRLIKHVLEIYREADGKAWSENNQYYRVGNMNALNVLCNRLGIDLVSIVKADKECE